ncbi:UNVERIFIED_CONTAM: tRNA (guanine(37)-N1)-methyltransferase 1, partial [Sesamum angustifolium]
MEVSGDVFAGVGPIAISVAKKVKRVYANGLNPCAVECLERNCVLNKIEGKFSRKSSRQEYVLPRIHVYGFSKAQDLEFDFHERIRIALSEPALDVEMHRLHAVAPGKWMLCASFILPEKT